MGEIIFSGTLKGEAKPLPSRWMEGFRDAFEVALHGLPMEFGPYGSQWGSAGVTPDGGGYGNGYSEGTLSGWNRRRYCQSVVNIFGTHG